MTMLIRLGATTELGLMVAESTGQFQGILPLAGSPVAQIAIVLGIVAFLHDLVEIVGDTVQFWRRRRRLRGQRRLRYGGAVSPEVVEAPRNQST